MIDRLLTEKIVLLKNKIWAIEVKSRDATDQDLGGLKAFYDYFPEVHQRVLVTPKDKKRRKNGILICDWVTLLKEMDL